MQQKTINREEGFTIIEVIVAINISLIAIAVIFTFYLFLIKFNSSLEKKIDHENNVYSVLYNLEKKLDNSSDFSFNMVNNSLSLVVNDTEIVYFNRSRFLLNNEVLLSDINNVELYINPDSEDKYIYKNGQIVEGRFDSANSNTIKNEEIREFFLLFEYHGRKITFRYNTTPYSSGSFNNLTEDVF